MTTAATSPPPYGTGPAPADAAAPGAAPPPRRTRVHHLREMKKRGERWAMLTAYDLYAAAVFDEAGIPALLVGDSAANNVTATRPPARDRRRAGPARPRRGRARRALVVADLPFGSYEAGPGRRSHTAVRFMKEAGAHAVKLEGGARVAAADRRSPGPASRSWRTSASPRSPSTPSAVPGAGPRRDGEPALADAQRWRSRRLRVVLEMVPGASREITPDAEHPHGRHRRRGRTATPSARLAGHRRAADGPAPRFVKQYADLHGTLLAAARDYAADVAAGSFPAPSTASRADYGVPGSYSCRPTSTPAGSVT